MIRRATEAEAQEINWGPTRDRVVPRKPAKIRVRYDEAEDILKTAGKDGTAIVTISGKRQRLHGGGLDEPRAYAELHALQQELRRVADREGGRIQVKRIGGDGWTSVDLAVRQVSNTPTDDTLRRLEKYF